jgi:hypothetical protein
MNTKEIIKKATCFHKEWNYYLLSNGRLQYIRQCKKCGQLQRRISDIVVFSDKDVWTNLVQLTPKFAEKIFGENK